MLSGFLGAFLVFSISDGTVIKRNFYGQPNSYYYADPCRPIPCGNGGATYDPKLRACLCNNRILCRTKHECTIAVTGCPSKHMTCNAPNYTCSCRGKPIIVPPSTSNIGGQATCNQFVCGGLVSTYKSSIDLCTCGLSAICLPSHSCKHVLDIYLCPAANRVCDKMQCKCIMNGNVHRRHKCNSVSDCTTQLPYCQVQYRQCNKSQCQCVIPNTTSATTVNMTKPTTATKSAKLTTKITTVPTTTKRTTVKATTAKSTLASTPTKQATTSKTGPQFAWQTIYIPG